MKFNLNKKTIAALLALASAVALAVSTFLKDADVVAPETVPETPVAADAGMTGAAGTTTVPVVVTDAGL